MLNDFIAKWLSIATSLRLLTIQQCNNLAIHQGGQNYK